MTPHELLDHCDSGQLWASSPSITPGFDVSGAYQLALDVRALRLARGEKPCGFKIGFTNSSIWPRYDVFGPIWGTVYDTTLTFCDGEGDVRLTPSCQPRLEPEAVFGMRATPAANASLDDLFDAIEWVAPGFEIVQAHLPDWKFKVADTVADGGLHVRLLIGSKVPVRQIANRAQQLDDLLARTTVTLFKRESAVEQGRGANVLGGPLRALQHFLQELRHCPGAPDLRVGDVVTTGTWTDAWAVQTGETWSAVFDSPMSSLTVPFRP